MIFRFKNGLPYEDGYLSQCAMAQMVDKQIFRDELNPERKTSFDTHFYYQTQTETVHTLTMDVKAVLDGCDDLSLVFDVTLKGRSIKHFKHEDLLNLLDILKQSTVYPSVLSQVIDFYQSNDYVDDPAFLNGETKVALDNRWSFRVLAYDTNNKTIYLRLFLERSATG